MKKPINNTPYAEAIKPNQEFQSQVFGQEKGVYKKPDPSLTNIGKLSNFNVFPNSKILNKFHVSLLKKKTGWKDHDTSKIL